MTIGRVALKYLALYAEPAGPTTFGVRHATAADFLAIPYMEGSLKIDFPQETLDPMLGTTHLDGASKKVLGRKSCTVAFDVPLHSHGVDLDGDNAVPTVTTWALMRLLKIIFGGASSTTAPGAQTEVQASSTTTLVKVTAGHGVRFARGGCIACDVAGTGLIEIREIASVSTDDITVKEAFSAIPATGGIVRGGITFYPANLNGTGDAAQFLWQGESTKFHFGFHGCNGTVALAVDMKTGLSKLSFSLAGVNWDRLADHAGITAPTYANVGIIRTIDAPFTAPDFGDTTRSPFCIADFKLELGIAYEDLPCGEALNQQGIGGKHRSPGRPVAKGSFLHKFESQAEMAAFEARTDRSIFAQFGVLPGAAMLVSVPLAQTEQPQIQPIGGVDGELVPFFGRPDTTGGTSDRETAAVRLHFV